MTGPLLTGRQVADMLGVSNKTILRWALEGELPSIRLSNRAIRFRPSDIDQWLDERATPGGSANDQAKRRPLQAIVSPANDPREPTWPEH